MKKLFLMGLPLIFLLINFLYAGDNIFNNYLLHNENFKITYPAIVDQNLTQEGLNIKIKNFKRNPFSEDKIKKFFDIHSKVFNPELNLKINNSSNFSLNFKQENSEFTPVSMKKETVFGKGFSFDFKQFWRYNVASQFSYIYHKEYFNRLNKFNFSEKKYSVNITKFFNKNKFDILYQYSTADNNLDKGNIYMLQDEKTQKISLSYELTFSKRFSLVLLYSLKETSRDNENFSDNLIFSGFKYSFDSTPSK